MVSATSAFIVIPTYWTWPSTEDQRPALAAYDHPTPLDSDSTLPPLLEDLAAQVTQGFRVLVLAGLAHPDLGPAVSHHMRRLLGPYRSHLDMRLCDSNVLEGLRDVIRPTVLQSELIHLGSYAGIRNLQLLVPYILGAEAVIALDDDERVKPDYVERALGHLGADLGGQRVLGIAGPYLQRDGSVLLSEPTQTGNVFHDKPRYINAAMQSLTMRAEGLVPSPMALGGNMLFHRELIRSVCFDPGITRGEDIDYLINAHLEGIPWWFDPQLTILHLPPRHLETPPYQRTREDVLRFIYEREKLRLHGEQGPTWLEPYPGAMLGQDVEAHALAALQRDATPELVERLGNPARVITEAHDHAARYASRYAAYLAAWRDLMSGLDEDFAVRQSAAGVFAPM